MRALAFEASRQVENGGTCLETGVQRGYFMPFAGSRSMFGRHTVGIVKQRGHFSSLATKGGGRAGRSGAAEELPWCGHLGGGSILCRLVVFTSFHLGSQLFSHSNWQLGV